MARLASSRLTAHGCNSVNLMLQLKLIRSGKCLQQIASKSTRSTQRAPRPPPRARVGRWWGSGAGRVLGGERRRAAAERRQLAESLAGGWRLWPLATPATPGGHMCHVEAVEAPAIDHTATLPRQLIGLE